MFKDLIQGKTNAELIKILNCSQDYKPEFIELVKKELEERGISEKDYDDLIACKEDEELENTELREPSSDRKISGWLTVFLFIIGIGGILTPIMGFKDMSISDYDIGTGKLWAIIGAVSDSILLLGILGLAFYTIKSFLDYKPNAVALGKSYLIIVFISNFISLIIGDLEQTGFFSSPQTVIRLIWEAVWFLYLCFSMQVETLFPKEKRKILKLDKIIFVSIIAPGLIWAIFSFVPLSKYLTEQVRILNAIEQTIDELELSDNEYTDGKIIFKKPAELSIEKQTKEDDIFFILEKEDKIIITLYGAVDNNDTKAYFDEAMQEWSDEYFDDVEYEVLYESHSVSDGNSVYTKILQYDTEPVVKWTFVLIFNEATAKACLISCFSTEETDILNELIDSVRFK